MDTLTVDAAEEIAKHLLDEQDIAALQQTCRFWRGVYSSGELWRALLELRFGPHAAEEADRGEAQAAFRRLAELQVPVATDASVAWLGSNYVEAVGVPGTAAGQAVRVNAVCWLALSYTFPGVLPGAYQARCRLRCQPHFFTDELIIDAVPAAGCGSPASRTYSLQELRDASVAESVAGWFELATGVVAVERLCTVEVRVHSTSGVWKQGLMFDTLRLVPAVGGGGARGRGQQSAPGAGTCCVQ